MAATAKFDTDGDGMIENEGGPDQTYDIWTATGVTAYCGGLWVAACLAAEAAAAAVGDAPRAAQYGAMAARARGVYVSRLWNGVYLDYDSSGSGHHDSVMADMLAGQWYVRASGLPPVLPDGDVAAPGAAGAAGAAAAAAAAADSRPGLGQSGRAGPGPGDDMALSCYRAIYHLNVRHFADIAAYNTHHHHRSGSGSGSGGGGRPILLGAVNGMRPSPALRALTKRAPRPYAHPTSTPLGTLAPPPGAVAIGAAAAGSTVDSSCMQSREVWTGTTYALAAGMIHQARAAAAAAASAAAAAAAAADQGKGPGPGPGAPAAADADKLPQPPHPITGATPPRPAAAANTTTGAASASALELLLMAFNTARGVADGGWGAFGYHFATPEAWEGSGNYRYAPRTVM
jgi:hypothetical protein